MLLEDSQQNINICCFKSPKTLCESTTCKSFASCSGSALKTKAHNPLARKEHDTLPHVNSHQSPAISGLMQTLAAISCSKTTTPALKAEPIMPFQSSDLRRLYSFSLRKKPMQVTYYSRQLSILWHLKSIVW